MHEIKATLLSSIASEIDCLLNKADLIDCIDFKISKPYPDHFVDQRIGFRVRTGVIPYSQFLNNLNLIPGIDFGLVVLIFESFGEANH